MRDPEVVSILMPLFERVSLAFQAVESAARQRSVSVELIVVDDGSTEDTSLLRAEVESLGGVFIRIAHAGIAAARNAGIAAARGRWVAFLDSDDIFYPHKLQRQLAAMG